VTRWPPGQLCGLPWGRRIVALSPKLQSLWDGAYEVDSRINDVVCRIQRNVTTETVVAHLNRLTLWQGTTQEYWPWGGNSGNSWIAITVRIGPPDKPITDFTSTALGKQNDGMPVGYSGRAALRGKIVESQQPADTRQRSVTSSRQSVFSGSPCRWCGDFFLDFPIYLQSVYIHSNTISKLCVEKRRRVEKCSAALLRKQRAKTLCGCREKKVQTKEKCKLRLTTKAYKLSYNYINYTMNLVGRSFGRWRRSRLRSGCSRRVRRMSFGCAVRRAL
jgi:hypothetical protein